MSSTFTVDRDVAVPMRDGVILRADVYRPAAGTASAVVFRTGYNKAGRASVSGDFLPMIQALEAGYAFVVQDLRGRFASEGEWIRDGGNPYGTEVQDGFDTIEWVAEQSWCDGNVATAGGSYLANVQWASAAAQPPHLRAMAPWIGRSGAYLREDAQLGGMMMLYLDVDWTANMAIDVANRLEQTGRDVREMRAMIRRAATHPEEAWFFQPLEALPHFKFEGVERIWQGMLKQANPAPGMDVDWDYAKVGVPALHVGGWFDVNNYGTFHNYQGLKSGAATRQAREGQHVIVGPWAHGMSLGAYLGGLNFGRAASADGAGVGAWHLQFLNKYVKGLEAEIPAVRYFVMGRNEWRTASDWPVPGTDWQRWYLHSAGHANSASGDGRLSRELPLNEATDEFVYDPSCPVPTMGGHFTPTQLAPGPVEQSSVEGREDVLCFTSEPLPQDLEVTGPLVLYLYAATTAPDTDFTAKLVDVHPDGRAFNIADGGLRARFRDSLVEPRPVQPGEVNEYRIHLRNTSMVFRKGHRIRIDVTSSDFPRWDRNMNTGAPVGSDVSGERAKQTIFHDSQWASYIDLPVIPQSNHEAGIR
jgi:putative CocE/NonD family hydrolase